MEPDPAAQAAAPRARCRRVAGAAPASVSGSLPDWLRMVHAGANAPANDAVLRPLAAPPQYKESRSSNAVPLVRPVARFRISSEELAAEAAALAATRAAATTTAAAATAQSAAAGFQAKTVAPPRPASLASSTSQIRGGVRGGGGAVGQRDDTLPTSLPVRQTTQPSAARAAPRMPGFYRRGEPALLAAGSARWPTR